MIKTPLTILVTLFLMFNSATFAAEGKPIDISSYKGKVVVLDFWASWCIPCRKSFPWLNEMHNKKSPQGLLIIGVNVDENIQDAKDFLKENPAIFDLIFDPKGQHASYYDIPGMPTTLIFDRNGKLSHQHSGFKTNKIKEYEAVLDRVLTAQ